MSANELPGTGAAVEVAAYRICVEALTNIVRHAHATAAELTLIAAADSLTIEVVGYGKTTRIWPPGTGITSMRERAALVGGTLTAGDRRVLANLPLYHLDIPRRGDGADARQRPARFRVALPMRGSGDPG